MASSLRQMIAMKLSQVTGLEELILLQYIKPLPVLPKKSYRPALSLSLQSLHNELYSEQKRRRCDPAELERLGTNVAKELSCPDHIQNISVEKQHLSFKISMPGISGSILDEIRQQDDTYGFHAKPWQHWKRRKILVEYSSPNIAKPFHAGHLRSTLIGHFVANLCSKLGHEVIRLNYLGDWGVQFGLLAVGFQKFGSVKELTRDPIQHLFEVYVKSNAAAGTDPEMMDAARRFFTAMEQGDEDSLSVWRRFREFSIKDYISVYQRLSIAFDIFHGESQYSDQAQDVLTSLRDMSLLETTDEGTSVVDISEYVKSLSKVTVARSDGSSLYLTRDVAAAIDRHQQYGFHRMIYVVDNSQQNHLKQLVGVLRKMKYSWADRIQHVGFGRVLGMKTRTGEVVFLRDILEESKNQMMERMRDKSTSKQLSDPASVAECLGISALILQDLKSTLRTDYKFDWDRVLKSQGDTGVFLQYTHARLKSIEDKSVLGVTGQLSPDLLCEPEAEQLLWHLAQFDEAVQMSYEEMEPRHLASYILRLSRLASRAAEKLRVIGEERALAESRLRLFVSARTVLANGMRVLGMTPLDKM